MPRYAVVARADKELGGGLHELRHVLSESGVTDIAWHELPEGADVRESVLEAVAAGTELLFVWGGDGSIQRTIDAVAGSNVAVAILPAGGGNVLARDLGVPLDVRGAVKVALEGDRLRMDTAIANGEHFAIVAGAGLSSLMMRDHHRKNVRERVARVARLGVGALKQQLWPLDGVVAVDGVEIYRGGLTCVLVSNIEKAVAGIQDFDDQPREDDGVIEIGAVGPRGVGDWVATFGRVLLGMPEPEPFNVTAHGRRISVLFSREVDFELDGSPKDRVRRLEISVRPRTVTVCVPRARAVESIAAEPAHLRADSN